MYRKRKTKKRYNPDKTRKSLYSKSKPCPFCDDKAKPKYQGKYIKVLDNIYSYDFWEMSRVKDHLMAIPMRHVESLSELNDKEKIEMIEVLAKYEKQGYNIYAREKDNKIKTVPHYHVHLIKIESKKPRAFLFIRKPYFTWKY